MRRARLNKKLMMVVCILLPSLGFRPVQAQQPIVLDLETALEIALSDNPTVKVAEAEIEKKGYAEKGAYASLFPQIDFVGSYNRALQKQTMVLGDNSIKVGVDNDYSLGFNAAMPLVNAQLWKSLSISALDVDLAVEQARASKIDMVHQVTKSYFGVMLAKDSYEVLLESYNNAMQNYLDVKQKYEQGTVAEYDLIRADVAVKNVEPSVFQAENAVTLAKWQLKALLALDLDLNVDIKEDLNDYEANLFGDYLALQTGLQDNTTLRQFDIQDELLNTSLKMQKFEYLPTLSLTGNYSWTAMANDFKFNNYNWNSYSIIGVTLTVPIFSGGSKYNAIRQTRVSIDQLRWQREDTERNLQLAVKQQMDNMNVSVKQYDAARKGIEQAERGYLIAQKRYDTGAGTLLELNDAELALTQARLNFNQSIYDYMTAKADLEQITGTRNF
ncbi:MAG: TolC family protein [Tannerellaceae bacterium]|nr:TolC family protein [Tannerellaceae bacterium]